MSDTISDEFAGKVAIVTGAGRGIGREIALAWVRRGASVVCAARSEDELARVVGEIETIGGSGLAVRCDALNEEDLRALVAKTIERFDRLDLVANNAGVGGAYDTLTTSGEEILDVYRVNAIAPLHLSRFAIPHILEAGGGAIVNISSGMAVLTDFGGIAYAGAKAALEQTTRMLALEFAPSVRVNAIRCGSIRTSMLEDGLLRAQPALERELERWAPAGRLGRPSEIAAAATFLCSDESAYITGEVLSVDGGLVLPKSPLALTRIART